MSCENYLLEDYHLKARIEGHFSGIVSTGSYPRTDTLECLKNRQSINQQVDGMW